MDWRELLKKYMQMVGDEEGTFFLYSMTADSVFTAEEKTALNAIVSEIPPGDPRD